MSPDPTYKHMQHDIVAKYVRRFVEYQQMSSNDAIRRSSVREMDGRLVGIAEVAADVLKMCMSPHEFRITVEQAITFSGPFPSFGTVGGRGTWIGLVVAEALERLGNGS